MSAIPESATHPDEPSEASEELSRRAEELVRLEELTRDWDESEQRILTAILSGLEELIVV